MARGRESPAASSPVSAAAHGTTRTPRSSPPPAAPGRKADRPASARSRGDTASSAASRPAARPFRAQSYSAMRSSSFRRGRAAGEMHPLLVQARREAALRAGSVDIPGRRGAHGGLTLPDERSPSGSNRDVRGVGFDNSASTKGYPMPAASPGLVRRTSSHMHHAGGVGAADHADTARARAETEAARSRESAAMAEKRDESMQRRMAATHQSFRAARAATFASPRDEAAASAVANNMGAGEGDATVDGGGDWANDIALPTVRDDEDVPGVTASKRTVVIAAGAGWDIFTVRLRTRPTHKVVLSFSCQEGVAPIIVRPPTLDFTPENYARQQGVRLRSIEADAQWRDSSGLDKTTVYISSQSEDPAYAADVSGPLPFRKAALQFSRTCCILTRQTLSRQLVIAPVRVSVLTQQDGFPFLTGQMSLPDGMRHDQPVLLHWLPNKSVLRRHTRRIPKEVAIHPTIMPGRASLLPFAERLAVVEHAAAKLDGLEASSPTQSSARSRSPSRINGPADGYGDVFEDDAVQTPTFNYTGATLVAKLLADDDSGNVLAARFGIDLRETAEARFRRVADAGRHTQTSQVVSVTRTKRIVHSRKVRAQLRSRRAEAMARLERMSRQEEEEAGTAPEGAPPAEAPPDLDGGKGALAARAPAGTAARKWALIPWASDSSGSDFGRGDGDSATTASTEEEEELLRVVAERSRARRRMEAAEGLALSRVGRRPSIARSEAVAAVKPEPADAVTFDEETERRLARRARRKARMEKLAAAAETWVGSQPPPVVQFEDETPSESTSSSSETSSTSGTSSHSSLSTAHRKRRRARRKRKQCDINATVVTANVPSRAKMALAFRRRRALARGTRKVRPKKLVRLVGVGLGDHHLAMVTADGLLLCCGQGRDGALGSGSWDDSRVPLLVPTLVRVRIESVACGGHHTLALSRDGRVFGFGRNDDGQLFLPHKSEVCNAAHVRSLAGDHVIAAACGDRHSLLLNTRSEVFSAGDNACGQLGLGHNERVPPGPNLVKTFRDLRVAVFDISCGSQHSAAVAGQGVCFTWGSGLDGRLGHGDCKPQYRPTAVSCLSPPLDEERVVKRQTPRDYSVPKTGRAVACGAKHTVLLTDAGEVLSWGGNEFGTLGIGSRAKQSDTPVLLTTLVGEHVMRIAAGGWHSVFVTEEGAVFTCGLGELGQTGLIKAQAGDSSATAMQPASSTMPQLVHGLVGLDPMVVACGRTSTCVLTSLSECADVAFVESEIARHDTRSRLKRHAPPPSATKKPSAAATTLVPRVATAPNRRARAAAASGTGKDAGAKRRTRRKVRRRRRKPRPPRRRKSASVSAAPQASTHPRVPIVTGVDGKRHRARFDGRRWYYTTYEKATYEDGGESILVTRHELAGEPPVDASAGPTSDTESIAYEGRSEDLEFVPCSSPASTKSPAGTADASQSPVDVGNPAAATALTPPTSPLRLDGHTAPTGRRARKHRPGSFSSTSSSSSSSPASTTCAGPHDGDATAADDGDTNAGIIEVGDTEPGLALAEGGESPTDAPRAEDAGATLQSPRRRGAARPVRYSAALSESIRSTIQQSVARQQRYAQELERLRRVPGGAAARPASGDGGATRNGSIRKSPSARPSTSPRVRVRRRAQHAKSRPQSAPSAAASPKTKPQAVGRTDSQTRATTPPRRPVSASTAPAAATTPPREAYTKAATGRPARRPQSAQPQLLRSPKGTDARLRGSLSVYAVSPRPRPKSAHVRSRGSPRRPQRPQIVSVRVRPRSALGRRTEGVQPPDGRSGAAARSSPRRPASAGPARSQDAQPILAPSSLMARHRKRAWRG